MKLATLKPEELRRGDDYLKKVGKFHLLVERILVGVSTKGTAITGSTVEMSVLAGPEKGKKVVLVLWHVKLNSSPKKQRIDQERLQNFFLATNVFSIEQLGGEIDFDEELAAGQQLIAEFSPKREDDGNGNYVSTEKIDWHYSNVWHVDDPRVKDVAKSAEALDLIDADKRHKPEWFAAITGEPVSATAADFEPNFDDI